MLRRFCLALCGLLGIIAAGQARAACEGKNLWTEFVRNHPQAAGEAEARLRAMPFGEGRLFRISRPGRPVSYVFGTIHLHDPRYLPLSGAVRRAFDATKVTVLELKSVKEAAAEQLAKENPKEFMLALFAESGERPSDFLDSAEQAQISAVAEKAGAPASYFLSMRPVMLAVTLALSVCPQQSRAEDGVDGEVERQSLKDAKLVIGLETILEQLAVFNGLPFDVQKTVLRNALRDLGNTDDAFETLKALYIEGKLGLILLGMQGKIPEFTAMGEANPPAYTMALIDERNRRMVQRALPLLDVNSTFIAVGGAHLPGETGILKLFQDAGYKVEKVE